MIALPAGPARHARVVLEPGRSLADAVAAAMAVHGWPSATLQLLGGRLARAVFVCSVLTPGGPRWIDYGPHRDAGACWLALGCATFGTAPDGGTALHCHALLADAAGLAQGGHLLPELTTIGPGGLVAHATSAPGAGFRVVPVSGFNLLSPG